MDYSLINILLHLDQFLAVLVAQYGVWVYLILFLVVFCETGVLVLPFLPGDSLLFVAGAVAATGGMNPYLLAVCLMTAAILGDSTNYFFGRRAGKALLSKPESRFIRRDYLERTHQFYEHHGGKTVAVARFVPIVRTFAPFVAGMAAMPYRKFLTFSVLGSIVWVGSLLTIGYQFGQVEFIRKNLSLIAIVGFSAAAIPTVLGMLRQYWRSFRQAG